MNHTAYTEITLVVLLLWLALYHARDVFRYMKRRKRHRTSLRYVYEKSHTLCSSRERMIAFILHETPATRDGKAYRLYGELLEGMSDHYLQHVTEVLLLSHYDTQYTYTYDWMKEVFETCKTSSPHT